MGTRPLDLLPHSGGGLEEQELRGLPAPACLCPAYLLAPQPPLQKPLSSDLDFRCLAWAHCCPAGWAWNGSRAACRCGGREQLASHRSITTSHSSILQGNPTGSFLPKPTHWKSTVYVTPVLPLSWHQGRQLDQREGPSTQLLYGLKQATQPLWASPAPSVCEGSQDAVNVEQSLPRINNSEDSDTA